MEAIKEANNLRIKKASPVLDIPVEIIKQNKDLISCFVYNNPNNALSSLRYPNGLKYPDVTPVLKKDDKSTKRNCRPISILPKLRSIQTNYAEPDLPLPTQNFFKVSVCFSESVQCATPFNYNN